MTTVLNNENYRDKKKTELIKLKKLIQNHTIRNRV